MPQSHIAMFIDWDNAQIKATEMDLENCRSSQLWVAPLVTEVECIANGTVDVRRCYGNAFVNSNAHHRNSNRRRGRAELSDLLAADRAMTADLAIQGNLANHGFQMIHTPPSASGKNRADILLALDCMETALTHNSIDTFAILSMDSDFSPLFHRLRALGKQVVWITVGRPQGPAQRALRSLSTYHVSYDQRLINSAGSAPLNSTLSEIYKNSAVSPEAGVPLSALYSRITSSYPGFAFENLGFDGFGQFVSECIDHPYKRVDNAVYLVQEDHAVRGTSMAEIVAVGTTPDLPSLSPQMEDDRMSEIRAVLNRQNIRPLPELRNAVMQILTDDIFDAYGQPQNSIEYGQLQDQILQNLSEFPDISKSRLSHVFRLLFVSRIFILSDEEDIPLRMREVEKIEEQGLHELNISCEVIRRISGAGVALAESDFPIVASLVFGDKGPDNIQLIEEAFRRVASDDSTEATD